MFGRSICNAVIIPERDHKFPLVVRRDNSLDMKLDF